MDTETMIVLFVILAAAGTAYYFYEKKRQEDIAAHKIVDPQGHSVQRVGGVLLNRDGSRANADQVLDDVASRNKSVGGLLAVGKTLKKIVPW